MMVSFPSMYGLISSASFSNDVLDILTFSLHSSSIIVPLIKLSHHALVLPGRVQNCLQWWFALFLTLWCPLFIDINLKTSCRSLMYWLCKFITAAFIWTHDIKLEIRATNKEAATLLYALFVYNACHEDWIQENDESVFVSDKEISTLESVFKTFWIRLENTLDMCGRKPYSLKNLCFHKFPDTCGICRKVVYSRLFRYLIAHLALRN